MHRWGDEDFDWDALNDCCDIVYRWSKRGFITGQIKEKYGTLRWYAMFGHLSLHSLCYPGYVYSQFPDWLWKLDCNYIAPVLRFFFERLFVWWQLKCYNWAYQACLKKHPHIRTEILSSADHPELIKGATRKECCKTHILGWNGETVSTWQQMGCKEHDESTEKVCKTDENS